MNPSVGALVRAELTQRRRMLGALAGGLFVFMLVLGGTYQAFDLASMARSFGVRAPAFFSAFSGEPGADIFAPQHYLAFGFIHPLFLVLTLTVGISVGSASVAGDVESGRGEMLYARPLRRTAILDARLALWTVSQLIVVAGAALGATVGSRLSSDLSVVSIGAILRVVVQFLPLSALFAAVAFAASAIRRTRGQALALAIGATAVAYLVNFVALLWHPMAFARRLTPFGYYSPIRATQSIEWVHAASLTAVAAMLVVAARIAVQHRDLI